MNNIIELSPIKNEARVDSRMLADHLGIQHKNVLAMIDQYQGDFEELGVVAFQTRKPNKGSNGGRPETFAMLNEDQSYLLLSFSRNTKRVRALKVELVKAFARFRQHKQTEADYLPFYHELHDMVKVLADHAHQHGSTTDERIFHINFNKLINKAFGLESGQRQDLPGHLRAKVTAANVIAKDLIEHAISSGMGHHEAYRYAKRNIEAFSAMANKRLEVA